MGEARTPEIDCLVHLKDIDDIDGLVSTCDGLGYDGWETRVIAEEMPT
jgi:hypothetical protein